MYNNIKPDYKSRLCLNLRLDQLHEYGLIKNKKTPFLILKINTTPFLFPYTIKNNTKLQILEEMNKQQNYSCYSFEFFIPRSQSYFNIPLKPEYEYIFMKHRNGLNELTDFRLNPLLSQDNKFEWFQYDVESMRFLMEMNKLQAKPTNGLKFIKNGVYFEDKCESYKYEEKDLKGFLISLTMNYIDMNGGKNEFISKKFAMNLKTTAYDLISSFNKKNSILKPTLKFDPNSKILKVKGLNDYIFDVKLPLVNFTFINECLKENKEANYFIIDNPLISKSNLDLYERGEGEYNSDNPRNSRSSIYLNKNLYYNENQFESLLHIASYNVDLDMKYKKYKTSPKIFYSKLNDKFYQLPKQSNQSFKPSQDSIDSLNNFIIDITNDLNKLKDNQYQNLKNLSSSQREPIKKDNFKELDSSNLNYIEYDLNSIHNIICDSITLPYKINKNVVDIKAIRKAGIKKHTPNIFKSNESLDMKELLENYSNPVDIRTVKQTFTILFVEAKMNNIYNSYPFDLTKDDMVLVFKLQLYCGSKPFSNPKQIKYTSQKKETHLSIREKINFDVKYQDIPNYCTLSIKIKQVLFNKNKNISSLSTIAWVNFRLFDHNKFLRTGTHKLGLFDKEFGSDSYYVMEDCLDENASSIIFEVDSFISPLINRTIRLNKYSLPVKNFNINYEKINETSKKTPFEELSKVERDFLWNNRNGLIGLPFLISKLVTDFHYTDYKYLNELEKFFHVSNFLTILQSIDLLSGKYLNDSIRTFAVKCIKKVPKVEVNDYLLQLVQGLKYEMNHDSELARYILQLSINYPTSIGHALFWALKSEMHNPHVQQRFGLYLEVFLYKIGSELSKFFYYENLLIESLSKTAIIVKEEKEKRMEIYTQCLSKINEFLQYSKYQISVPLNFKFNIRTIDISKCRIMKSKKKPLFLTFKNYDPYGEDIVVLFKEGDDLRLDVLNIQLFRAMQNLWYDNSIKLKMSLYKIMCTGYYQGMLEIVTNSETLASIQSKETGSISTLFVNSSLKKWMDVNCTVGPDKQKENFLLSNVAYCAATFVLGIADRHNDNIMLKKNGELFHIDFGHFLGHFKYKYGIKRERAPFVFTYEFLNVLGGEKSEEYKKFRELFLKSYKTLRNNSEAIISLLRILLCSGIPELDEKSIKYLSYTLALKKSDKEAENFLFEKLNESLNSWSTKFNFAIHILANK